MINNATHQDIQLTIQCSRIPKRNLNYTMLKQFTPEDFEYVKDIGTGYSANITLQRIIMTGELVAIKTFTSKSVTSKKAQDDFQRELTLLELVQTHSVNLIGQGSQEAQIQPNARKGRMPNPTGFLVLQYLPNGSLLQYINEFSAMSKTSSRHYFIKIVEIVLFLQFKNIVHRDLTLGNVMFNDEFELKIIDFAFSCHYSQNQIRFSKLNDYQGTPPYIAPELVEGAPYLPYPAEIFSLGVILYTIIHGVHPFVIASEEEPSYIAFITKPCVNEVDDLIAKMTTYNPRERITLSQILEHEWLKSYSQEDECTAIEEIKLNLSGRI